jgi:hypothetical protein
MIGFTPGKTHLDVENGPFSSLNHLLKSIQLVIFHIYVSLPQGTTLLATTSKIHPGCHPSDSSVAARNPAKVASSSSSQDAALGGKTGTCRVLGIWRSCATEMRGQNKYPGKRPQTVWWEWEDNV